MKTLELTPDSRTLDENIEIAIKRIREFEPPEGYYLAFSGGKDSQVLYELATMAGVRFDAHFNFTTADPPEVLRFIRENYPGVQWNRPEKTMWQLIPWKLYPPTRTVRYCCEWLKERGGKGRFVLTGIRKEESIRRGKRRMVEVCYKDTTRRYLHPIIDWTSMDVWGLIRQRGLEYCELYDQGYSRIGCVGCPMAGREERLKGFERWPNFKKAYLRAFGEMLKARREKGTKTNWNWRTAEDVMEWWLKDRKVKVDPDQLMMFSD